MPNEKRTALIAARGDRTQANMADMLGVAQQTYAHWESGGAVPRIPVMLKLEQLTGVSKEQLFSDVFDSKYELKKRKAV